MNKHFRQNKIAKILEDENINENKKVMIITLLFSKNKDLEKWTNICEVYINKYLDPDKWKISRYKYLINCSKK